MLIQKNTPYVSQAGDSYSLWSVSLAVSSLGGDEVAVAVRLVPARRAQGKIVLCTDEGCERAVSTTTSANPRLNALTNVLGATVRAFIEAAGV
jgi:hypothetical protein